jgi:hypothetical protein
MQVPDFPRSLGIVPNREDAEQFISAGGRIDTRPRSPTDPDEQAEELMGAVRGDSLGKYWIGVRRPCSRGSFCPSTVA